MEQKIKKIGIRKETKTDEEKRCALPPIFVKELLEKCENVVVKVQPGDNRLFKMEEFLAAGAIEAEDISDCDLIIGVKEITQEYLYKNKTYMNFPHVIKAQPANMDILDHIINSNIRLIDYERIVDEHNNRLIAFGRFAGTAGAIDFLHGLGQYLQQQGHPNQLHTLLRCHQYNRLDDAKQHLYSVREQILMSGMFNGANKQALVMGVTGSGRCSAGVMEILQCLGVEVVQPNALSSLNLQDQSKIFVVQFTEQHMVQKKSFQDPQSLEQQLELEQQFDKKDYRSNPEDYKPIFHERYLKYLDVLFHGMYWDKRYPRLISDQQVKDLIQKDECKLIGICDITCDLEGSIEMCKQFTTVEQPYFTYDPLHQRVLEGRVVGPHYILYESLDYLPTMLPYDASMHFGRFLVNWIPNILNSDPSLPLQQQALLPEIQRAVITCNSQLTSDYQYILDLRKKNS